MRRKYFFSTKLQERTHSNILRKQPDRVFQEARRRYERGELDPMKNKIFVKNQNEQFIETLFHLCTLWRDFKLIEINWCSWPMRI